MKTAQKPAAAEIEQELEKVPSWVTDGWYSNNPGLQKLAIVRWREPVTSPSERAWAADFVLPPAHSCTGCGKFAFPQPTVCFWCRQGCA